jgi:hypothetical protein
MASRTELVKVKTASGKTIGVEAMLIGGEEDVAAGMLSFDGVADALDEISRTIVKALDSAKPKKATVEFGLEVALESGKLTAMLVKGSGTASLKVTLEWEGPSAAA